MTEFTFFLPNDAVVSYRNFDNRQVTIIHMIDRGKLLYQSFHQTKIRFVDGKPYVCRFYIGETVITTEKFDKFSWEDGITDLYCVDAVITTHLMDVG